MNGEFPVTRGGRLVMPTLIPRTEAVAILMLAASVLLVVAIAFAF